MRSTRFFARFALLLLLGAPLFVVGPLEPSAGAISGAANHGGIVTNFGLGMDDPEGIASGPDGALWFTNSRNNSSNQSGARDGLDLTGRHS